MDLDKNHKQHINNVIQTVFHEDVWDDVPNLQDVTVQVVRYFDTDGGYIYTIGLDVATYFTYQVLVELQYLLDMLRMEFGKRGYIKYSNHSLAHLELDPSFSMTVQTGSMTTTMDSYVLKSSRDEAILTDIPTDVAGFEGRKVTR